MTTPTDPTLLRDPQAPSDPTVSPGPAVPSDPTGASELTTPSDPGYDGLRRAWNLTVDQRPAAVARPADVEGLHAVLREALGSGRRVALQATGHGAAAMGPLDDVLLVRTDAVTGVEVDATARRARVLAGTPVGVVTAAAAEHGLAFLAGSSTTVGAVGYTLGGGLGWLGRRFGFACNHVTRAEVVTADGARRWVDHRDDPDLFWALRGGGGSFAAVTQLEVALEPVAHVQAGTLSWPIDRAEEVLATWRDWTREVPATITSIARLLRYPPLPDLPPQLRGRALVGVELASLDDEEVTDRWLRSLRALHPELDTISTMPVADLGHLHGDPVDPVPAATEHRLLDDLPDRALATLLDLAGPDATCPLLAVDLRHLGAALRTGAADHGALDRVDAGYAAFGVGLPVDATSAAAVPIALDGLRRALDPWGAEQELLNLADRPIDPARLVAAERFARLRAVRAAYDPDGRFVANHPIPLPGAAGAQPAR
jgi:FAD/FMN-containing dehydrogenase